MPSTFHQDTIIPEAFQAYHKNKKIPAVIEKNVLTALSHYPELLETSIHFVFKQRIKNAVMEARPVAKTLLGKKKNRVYHINISALMKFTHKAIPIHQLPDSILIGWIGHELGHIMDYEQRSTFSLAGFGISYLLSPKFVQKAERAADTFAVSHGLGRYILETKHFILENADIPEAYKSRIERLYLSPDDILEQVLELEKQRDEGKL